MKKQTGPRTVEGKEKSSRNAIKSGVYSTALMPDESPQDVEDSVQNIMHEFGLQGHAHEIVVRQFVHVTMQRNRLQKGLHKTLQHYFSSSRGIEHFCIEANLDPEFADKVPAWYFDSSSDQKVRSELIWQIWREALDLRANYSVELIQAAQSKLPKLWAHVMKNQSDANRIKYTLGEMIAFSFKQSRPEDNVQALIDSIEEKFQFELLWINNAQRFLLIIDSIQAQLTIEQMTDDRISAAESKLHKRFQELLTTIHQLSAIAKSQQALSSQKGLKQIATVELQN